MTDSLANDFWCWRGHRDLPAIWVLWMEKNGRAFEGLVFPYSRVSTQFIFLFCVCFLWSKGILSLFPDEDLDVVDILTHL